MSFPASSTQTRTVTLLAWPLESSRFAFAVIFAGAPSIGSDARLAQLKAICCHESIGSPLPSVVAAANRSLETQLIVAESRGFEPEDDLMDMCDGIPLLGSQKTTTAMVPASVIRRSGHRVLRLNPKDVCACNGFSGTGGGTGAAWTSTGTLKTTHVRVAPSQLCIGTANVQALPARNSPTAPSMIAILPCLRQCLALEINRPVVNVGFRAAQAAHAGKHYAARTTSVSWGPPAGSRFLHPSCQDMQISIASPREFAVDSGLAPLLPDSGRAASPGQKILMRLACGNSS